MALIADFSIGVDVVRPVEPIDRGIPGNELTEVILNSDGGLLSIAEGVAKVEWDFDIAAEGSACAIDTDG